MVVESLCNSSSPTPELLDGVSRDRQGEGTTVVSGRVGRGIVLRDRH